MSIFKKDVTNTAVVSLVCALTITCRTEYPSAFADRDLNSQQRTTSLAANAWNLSDEASTNAGLTPEDLNLTVDEASDCSQALMCTGHQGYITIKSLGVSRYRCDIHITVKETMLIHLRWTELNGPQSCGYCHQEAVDQGRAGQTLMFRCQQTEIRDVISFTNKVRVSLMYFRFLQTQTSCFMSVRFKAVLASEKQQLWLNYASPSQGYIQTPGWDGNTLYPPLMDSWVALRVPEAHTVMLSLTSVDVSGTNSYVQCPADSLQLFAGGTSPENLVWECCRMQTDFVAKVFNTSVIYVHFVSDFRDEFSGFRLLFTFHNHSSSLVQMSDSTWNCSVPHWPEFQYNFPCDLVSQCVGGEDEATCPYISDVCEPGQVYSNGTCYLYTTHLQTDWWGANDFCVQRGMRLPILNIPEKFSSAVSLLQARPRQLLVFLGLQIAASALPPMYSRAAHWVDGTQIYHRTVRVEIEITPSCGYMFLADWLIDILQCTEFPFDYDKDILCENDPTKGDGSFTEISLLPQNSPSTLSKAALQMCPQSHFVHAFMSCDVKSSCFVQDDFSPLSCLSTLNSTQKFFSCTNGFQYIPYTLVCNYVSDCSDRSDEDFCVFQECTYENPFTCGNQQCVSSKHLCDGSQDCANGGDEMCPKIMIAHVGYEPPPPPAIINLSNKGKLEVFTLTLNRTDLESPTPCPETHFKCPGNSVFCMPVFLRCNGVYDCPGKEDEARCDNYLCPGFYRCRDSSVCVHPSNLCDGLHQCPWKDDELLCELICPDNCTCHGLYFVCVGPFPTEIFPDLRYLDATGTGMGPQDIQKNRMLVHVVFADCDLYTLGTMTLPNLQTLDLSDNFISSLNESDFTSLSNLRTLVLSGNPLSVFFTLYSPWKNSLLSVIGVDMSRVALTRIDSRIIKYLFPKVEYLNFSGTGLTEIQGDGSGFLKTLKRLDIRGCPLTTFPNSLLQKLEKLDSVQADNYKFCCQQLLPEGFNAMNCVAPTDEISSCDALLGSKTHKVFFSLYSAVGLTANALCFGYRCLCLTHERPLDIFQINLCVANFFTGVYLAVINIADRSFQNSFVWFDTEWRNSIPCMTAACIAWISYLAALFFILLITIERLLELLVSGTRYTFQKRSAWGVSAVVWFVGLLWPLAFVWSRGQNWTLTGQTSICFPLPLPRTTQAGYENFLKGMIVPIFVISLVTGCGQLTILFLIRNENEIEAYFNKERPNADTRQTLNLTAFNFVCFTVISGLGILSTHGTTFPKELNTALAIYVMPLSSALNPVIFFFNLVQRRHRQEIRSRLMQRLMSRTMK